MKSHADQPTNKKELNKKLADAAYRGQLELVRELVEQKGAEVNSYGSNPETPLAFAANYGRTEVVKYLTEHGANLDARGAYGRTALMYVVTNDFDRGDEDYRGTLNFLIQSGMDVNATDEDGKTALMYAVEHHNLQATKLLIESRAMVNAADKHGETSLIYACSGLARHEVIEILISARADIKTTDRRHNTPLMLLSSSDSTRSSIELLIRSGADRNDLFRYGETELMYAVLWNDFQWVEKLLKEGADINAQDHSGKTALMIAAQHHDINLMKHLVKAGATINAQDNSGYSALLHASYNKEKVTFLIQAGADINVVAKNGETAINQAVYWKHTAIIELLLNMHIKKEVINTKTEGSGFRGGHTPLGFAADHAVNGPYQRDKYRNIAVLLLNHGADPTIVCDGITALGQLSNNRSSDNEMMQALLFSLETNQKMNTPVSLRHFSFLKEKALAASAMADSNEKLNRKRSLGS